MYAGGNMEVRGEDSNEEKRGGQFSPHDFGESEDSNSTITRKRSLNRELSPVLINGLQTSPTSSAASSCDYSYCSNG